MDAKLRLLAQPLLAGLVLYIFYRCYLSAHGAEMNTFRFWVAGYFTFLMGATFISFPVAFEQFKKHYFDTFVVKPKQLWWVDAYQLVAFVIGIIITMIVLHKQNLIMYSQWRSQ